MNVWASSYADTLSDPNAARAHAGGTALASGISTGNGANRIGLFGDLTVTATSTATAYGNGEDYGEAYVGSATTAGIIADARGVVVGNGNNTIVNAATLQVTAQSTASSSGITDDDDDFSAAVANAQAKAYGIFTGNGNNALINYGTIDVTAEAQATVYSTTSNQQAYSSAQAFGIQTGSGDDLAANFGTIITSRIVQGTTSRGIAIDTGAGNDWVVLGEYSTTAGDILLGTGDDTLMFLGSAVVEDAIDPGTGSNTLVFDGTGMVSYAFAGFENTSNRVTAPSPWPACRPCVGSTFSRAR